MSRTVLAIVVHLLILLLVIAPPLWVRATGTVVFLETEKMDPRALFRGHYVILGYKLAQGVVSRPSQSKAGSGDNVLYVTMTTERPARFVAVSDTPPSLGDGEACIVGRKRGWGGAVDFPQVAQFFAPRDEARRLEGQRGEALLAQISTSPGCNAVLVDLVPH